MSKPPPPPPPPPPGPVRTSIYLPADLATAWHEQRAAGHTMTDIVRAGLQALGSLPAPVTRDDVRTIIREELTAARKRSA